jgi:phytoene synthase
MTPHEYCADRAAQSGSSFYYSFMFLSAPRRRAITALYAFCREVDDAVDETTDANAASAKLAWWRDELAAVYNGNAQHPVARALADVAATFDLKHDLLTEIIDGMQMDLGNNRYENFAALTQYCHRVAGVVGLLSARIFGYTDPRTLDYAHDLGIAFQLTNIIRDVGEDARRDRIYLPLDDMTRYGVTPADLLHGKDSEGMRGLLRFQVARARSFYTQALRKLPAADRRTQRAGLIMAAIYQRLLNEIDTDSTRVLSVSISLSRR